MAKWVPIQKSQHQNTGWKSFSSYSFAQQDVIAPLLLAEISQAIPFYPMGFIKNGEHFEFIAIQSLQPSLNLYVNAQGQWRVPYILSVYRGYPFRFLKNKDTDELIFCFDQDSGLIVNNDDTDNSNPLFDDNGELSEKAKGVMSFLQQCELNQQITQNAVNALAEQRLITPWSIQRQNSDSSTQPVEGLYRIDEAALQQADTDTLTALQKAQALPLAYAQLYSQARLQSLSQLYQLHESEQQQQQTTQNVDLNQLFGESEEDVFKF